MENSSRRRPSWAHHLSRMALALGATLALGVTPLATASTSTTTVRIGLIGPFTGGSADFGNSMRNGVELALAEINALGGYVGRQIELVVRDDQGDPERARRMSEQLIDEGVIAAIGFCNTGNALKSMDLYQKARVPLIVPCATGTPITTTYPAAQSYIFRTSARDSLQVPFVVNEAVHRGWTKIAVLADNTGYGEAGLKDLTRAMEAHKLKPVYVGRFDIGVKDMTDAVRQARDAGAQALFTLAVGPENAVIGRAREALGWKVSQIGPWGLTFPSYIQSAKSAAEGTLMAMTFVAEPTNERRSSFLSNYRRHHKTDQIPVPIAAAQAYDALYLLTYAMLTIKQPGFDGAALKRALETNDRPYYGVVATYKNAFSSSDHDAMTENMLYLGTVRNGVVTFAYPEDAKRNYSVQRKLTAQAPQPAPGR